MDCEFCGKKINELPRKCTYCGHYFCSDHRLPESHECQGLKQHYNREQHKLQNAISKMASTHAKVNDRGYEDIVNIESNKFKKEEVNIKTHTHKTSREFEILIKGFLKIPLLVGWLCILLIVSKIVNSIFLTIGYSIEPFGFLSFVLFYAILFFSPVYLIYRFFQDMPSNKKIYYYFGGLLSIIVIFFILSWVIPKIPNTAVEREFYVPNSKSTIHIDMNQYQYFFYTSLNKAYFMNWISQVDIFDKYFFRKNIPIDLIKKLKTEYPFKTDDMLVQDIVSLVQHLDYDYSKSDSLHFQVRFPYETLYEKKGVCIEKSLLLLKLLNELNYNTALITFSGANHAGVGIQCNDPNFEEFCFIESTDFYSIGEVPLEFTEDSFLITRFSGAKKYTK